MEHDWIDPAIERPQRTPTSEARCDGSPKLRSSALGLDLRPATPPENRSKRQEETMPERRAKTALCLLFAPLCALAAMLVAPDPARAEQVTLHWLEWWDGEWGKDTMDALTQGFE